MIPINNSDTAWLIVADFNQDNGIGFPEQLREDILSPDVYNWSFEFLAAIWGIGADDDFEEGISPTSVGDGDTTSNIHLGGYVGGYINVVIHGGYVGGRICPC